MSIVSRYLDGHSLLPMRRVKTCPAAVDDNGDAKPPEFEMAATIGGYTTQTARDICRPAETNPPKLNYVPLKCDQVGSHALGAALFNAPMMIDIDKLKTPVDRAMDNQYRRFTGAELYTEQLKPSSDYQPHLRNESLDDLVRGMRGPVRVKVSPIGEPAALSYRP